MYYVVISTPPEDGPFGRPVNECSIDIRTVTPRTNRGTHPLNAEITAEGELGMDNEAWSRYSLGGFDNIEDARRRIAEFSWGDYRPGVTFDVKRVANAGDYFEGTATSKEKGIVETFYWGAYPALYSGPTIHSIIRNTVDITPETTNDQLDDMVEDHVKAIRRDYDYEAEPEIVYGVMENIRDDLVMDQVLDQEEDEGLSP